MAKKPSKRIGSVPWPDQPISVEIPAKLLAEFQNEARIVVRRPWPIGIPVPDRMLSRELLSAIRGTELEVMAVPEGPLSLPMIGTWPTPEKPVTIEIPPKLLVEFQKDARIVMRHPWLIGIPIPSRMLDRKLLNAIRGTGFEILAIPKGGMPAGIP